MDANQQNPLTDDFKQVMQTLPPLIRNYLVQGKHVSVAKTLMTKYRLRIDQGGILEREVTFLLMGIENPDEFTQSLATDAGLDQKAISGIVQDINEQIFIPLRQEEETKNKAENVPVPTVPQPTRPTSVGVPNYAQPKPTQNFNLDNKMSQGNYTPPPQSPRYPGQNADVNSFVHRVPQPPANPVRPSVSVISPPAPKPPVIPTSSTAPASVPNSSQMLSDHEEPHIELNPQPIPPPTSRPLPPPNLPGAFPPPSATVPAAPKAPPPPPAPITPYSTDPYHEPIE